MIRSLLLGLLLFVSSAHAQWTMGTLTGFSEADRAIAVKTLQYVNESVYGPCFEQKVLSGVYRETNKKTQAQILAMVRADRVVDLKLYRAGNPFTKVVAYVSDLNGPINLNRKFWVAGQEKARANTLVHETLHKLGFSHAEKPWPPTVPYSVGDFVESCLTK